ncbi:MAG TPA: diguanylate cyclase, partial [Dissulfurispiraceae bacterium]|nr:diguanylate cyclase [Dissulfurispiraceae bacterium]
MKTFGLNVLLIEDNNGDAELIREMLCSSGFDSSLKRAERLSEGLKLLEAEPFDVLLLDLGLPDSIGVSALAEINKKKQDLPVIVFTGREDDEFAAKALSLGAQDYLLKGRIDRDMLYRSITYSINRKQAEETIRKAKELSEALNGINSFINSTLDADEIMQRVVAKAARLTGADGSSIGLFQNDHVFMKYVYNMPSGFIGLNLTPGEAKHIYYVASRREAIAFNDTATDERIDAGFFSRFGIISALAAPLITRDVVIGAICFYCLSHRCAFTEMYVDFAQKLSTAVSAALENARLYASVKKMDEEIRHLAYHDALTGLPNRRLFHSLLTHEVAQARRHNKKMALFFLDLDRFKDINDTLGHEAGDELLKEVAERLKATVRACDTIARIGGDEFNIILADIDHVEVIADIAEKIVECFRKTFTIDGHEFHISTSIGIGIFPDDSEDINTLLRYADIAMYHAKKVRNTYQFYDPEINVRTLERMQMN